MASVPYTDEFNDSRHLHRSEENCTLDNKPLNNVERNNDRNCEVPDDRDISFTLSTRPVSLWGGTTLSHSY
ncbi:hypothetical protein TNCV_3653581 [Trichonephila clavipes]|nr:hypothetical protein TNCV_3653581 [Trichonephila clavipes]